MSLFIRAVRDEIPAGAAQACGCRATCNPHVSLIPSQRLRRPQTCSAFPLRSRGCVPPYDVLVIGSGYGGSVAASRLARCGKRVCVLERGREISHGGIPAHDLRRAGRTAGSTPPGCARAPRTGLFDLSLNDDLHVLVGCGLGGTSLINANVALKADDRVLSDPAWRRR